MIRAMTESEKALMCAYLHYHPTDRLRGITKTCDGFPVILLGFDDWTANSVEMHVWVKEPKHFTRDFLRAAFSYPFEEIGLGIVITVVACNNELALNITRKAGFKVLAIVKDGLELGTDLAIQEMRRESCRWLKRVPRGQQVRNSSNP
jgi:RimJ/RimL family protein N-acetyltransferase